MSVGFRHYHHSGRFDATSEEFDRMLAAAQVNGDVCTLTEAYSAWMHAKIRGLPGWGAVAGRQQREQCAVVWDSRHFRSLHGDQVLLSGKRWLSPKHHLMQPMVAAVAVLEHRLTGERVAFVVTHTASHIQGFGRGKGARTRVSGSPRMVAAWLADCRALGRLRRRLAARWGCPVVVAADWNLDMRVRWCRVACLPAGGKLTWRKPWALLPGTHGRRCIDASRISGRRLTAGTPKTLAKVKGFDHTPYVETLYLNGKKGTP